jgi:hypothetical protein
MIATRFPEVNSAEMAWAWSHTSSENAQVLDILQIQLDRLTQVRHRLLDAVSAGGNT